MTHTLLRISLNVMFTAGLAFSLASPAVAAGGKAKAAKPKKNQLIPVEDVGTTTVQIKQGKKLVNVEIQCHKKTPGTGKARPGGKVLFKSFKDLKKAAKKAAAITRYGLLIKAGGKACKDNSIPKRPGPGAPTLTPTPTATSVPGTPDPNQPTPTPGPDITSTPNPGAPTPTPKPEEVAACLSLAPKTGTPTEEEILYLLEKAGFGRGNAEDALGFVQLGLTSGIPALVDALTTARSEVSGLEDQVTAYASQDYFLNSATALFYAELKSRNPVHRQAARFLQGYFTTGVNVLQQNQGALWLNYFRMLYKGALDDATFPELAIQVAKHPMMLIYLDGADNKKANPNENFGRELLELFSLAPAIEVLGANGQPETITNYTETRGSPPGDVLSAAKVLTGYTLQNNQAVFVPSNHETALQTIGRGTSWEFQTNNLEELIEQIHFRHPTAGQFIAREMAHHFVTENVPLALQDNIAKELQSNGFKIMTTLRTLLKSEAFFCSSYRNTVTKDPQRVVVEMAKTMGLESVIDSDLTNILNQIRDGIATSGFMLHNPETVFFYKPQNFRTGPTILENANGASRLSGYCRNASMVCGLRAKLPATPTTSIASIDAAAKLLGVTLNQAQKEIIADFMDHRFTVNQNGTVTKTREVFTGSNFDKLLALAVILSAFPDFLLA